MKKKSHFWYRGVNLFAHNFYNFFLNYLTVLMLSKARSSIVTVFLTKKTGSKYAWGHIGPWYQSWANYCFDYFRFRGIYERNCINIWLNQCNFFIRIQSCNKNGSLYLSVLSGRWVEIGINGCLTLRWTNFITYSFISIILKCLKINRQACIYDINLEIYINIQSEIHVNVLSWRGRDHGLKDLSCNK